ncbi:hypothetical protein WJX84_006121 [Apatococcus fuscideae]|uniref:Uncharacterized protein n=1 Tax=Apatococcus fuscideae TaxID=2026836 RepID=A0AAW1SMQ5_9CHLO
MSEAAARDSCSVQHLLQPEAFALTSRLQDIFVRSLPRARLGPPHTIQEDTQKASAWHEQGCLDMGGPYSAGAGPVSQAVIRLYSVISTGDSCELHLSVNDLRGRGCSTDSQNWHHWKPPSLEDSCVWGGCYGMADSACLRCSAAGASLSGTAKACWAERTVDSCFKGLVPQRALRIWQKTSVKHLLVARLPDSALMH